MACGEKGCKCDACSPVGTLTRVHLDRGGYDRSSGKYYGVGAPVYEYDVPALNRFGAVRAIDRETAKRKARAELRNERVRFGR